MKKIESIPAAAFLMASSVLLSRLLGYVREMVLAHHFGASATTDAFYAAFQIPDLLNYFLAGGALSIAFIPLYNKTLTQEGEAAAQRLVAVVLGTMGTAAVLLTAGLWIWADHITRFQFPAFDDATSQLTTHLTRIVLPAQVFFICGGILQAVLLAHRAFTMAALAPLIYNAAIIGGGLFLTPVMGIDGFAWGTLAGAVIGPFLLPLLQCLKLGGIRLSINPRDKRFLTYIVLALPLMFGQTLLTLDEWYGRWFGAAIGTGAVAQLGFARRLILVPIAVIGQAVAAAALPTLSKLWAEQKTAELNALLQKTLNASVILGVIAAVAMTVFASPMVALLYQHGAFTIMDGARVAALTAIMAVGIPAWIIQQITLRGFYARGDTWRPMIAGTIISLSVLPIYSQFSDRLFTPGLAVAGVIAMTLNALVTALLARAYHGAPILTGRTGMVVAALRGLAIALPACYAATVALAQREMRWPLTGHSYSVTALTDLACGGAAFAAVSLPLLFLLGGSDIRSAFSRFTRKKPT